MDNKTSEALFHINLFSLSPHVNISSTVFLTISVLGKRWPALSEVVAGQAASTYSWTEQETDVCRMNIITVQR